MQFNVKVEGTPITGKAVPSKDNTKTYYQCNVEVNDDVEQLNVENAETLAKLIQNKYKKCKLVLQVSSTAKYGTYLKVVDCE